MATITYSCDECGQIKTVLEGAPVPECCGERMHPRKAESPPHTMTAEADRFEDADDAFDDGVH